MKTGQLVYIGAVDWHHPTWSKGFYPDGLPADWLLSYYNTQFQAVYLPASTWQSTPDSTWTQWLEDTQENFIFVLEAGAKRAKPASERVWLASPEWEAAHVWWLDEHPDMRELARRIEHQAETGNALFVFSRSGNLAALEKVGSLRQVMGY